MKEFANRKEQGLTKNNETTIIILKSRPQFSTNTESCRKLKRKERRLEYTKQSKKKSKLNTPINSRGSRFMHSHHFKSSEFNQDSITNNRDRQMVGPNRNSKKHRLDFDCVKKDLFRILLQRYKKLGTTRIDRFEKKEKSLFI